MAAEAITDVRPAVPEPKGDEWTYADLQTIPEGGPKCEIAEGSLIVSTTPSRQHQFAAHHLCRLLEDAAPQDLVVLPEVDLDLGRNVFEPDVVVLHADAYSRPGPLRAADLVLAVEVTSPSSRSMDRVIKPAALAAAGVPHYWRVEVESDPYVEVFALRDGAFRQTITARAGAVLRVDAPFPIEFDPVLLVRK